MRAPHVNHNVHSTKFIACRKRSMASAFSVQQVRDDGGRRGGGAHEAHQKRAGWLEMTSAHTVYDGVVRNTCAQYEEHQISLGK